MCGRKYSTVTDEELAMRYLNKKRSWPWPVATKTPDFGPNYNFCPTQYGPALNVREGNIGLRRMRWGLVPSWAKSIKDADKYSLINARGEEITEKRSFKSAYQKRRCIIPVSGFFEWKRIGTKKRPFAVHLKDRNIMSLAGLWEEWVNKETGEVIESYAIVTTQANSYMEKIHNRMPVILAEEDEVCWLDPAVNDPKQVAGFLRPCPSSRLAAAEVSTLVNSPKNNSPDILNPIA
jgi:putative SOS response-associated peptidase YedK